jgi:hypothetical protein
VDPVILIPLGVFAMLVAFSYIEARSAIVHREALSREYLAAIEKGLPPPVQKEEPPKPPGARGPSPQVHPRGPRRGNCASGRGSRPTIAFGVWWSPR